MVSVIPLPVAGTASASSQLVCAGLNTTLYLTGNNGTVQWQVSVNDTFSFVTIPNATNSEYITPLLTTINQQPTVYYYRVIKHKSELRKRCSFVFPVEVVTVL